jgi:SpoVK/Ycf46/Vps4 family AAA+-type ATPase
LYFLVHSFFAAAAADQVIELPLKHPELFESLGIAQPKVRRTTARAAQLCSTSSSAVQHTWRQVATHCVP